MTDRKPENPVSPGGFPIFAGLSPAYARTPAGASTAPTALFDATFRILAREVAETLTGQKIHPSYFQSLPTGHRVHVIVDVAPAEWGGLVIPDASREKMGVGWVLAVGDQAGRPPMPYPGGPEVEQPEHLLGLRVVFGMAAGIPLRVTILDREFRAAVLILHDRDIHSIDLDPRPISVRSENPL